MTRTSQRSTILARLRRIERRNSPRMNGCAHRFYETEMRRFVSGHGFSHAENTAQGQYARPQRSEANHVYELHGFGENFAI
jgi:hypothetical protein